METLIFQEKNYVTIRTAAAVLNLNVSQIYYYFNQGRLQMVLIDKLKLVELDSLMQLNDYLAFRYHR